MAKVLLSFTRAFLFLAEARVDEDIELSVALPARLEMTGEKKWTGPNRRRIYKPPSSPSLSSDSSVSSKDCQERAAQDECAESAPPVGAHVSRSTASNIVRKAFFIAP